MHERSCAPFGRFAGRPSSSVFSSVVSQRSTWSTRAGGDATLSGLFSTSCARPRVARGLATLGFVAESLWDSLAATLRCNGVFPNQVREGPGTCFWTFLHVKTCQGMVSSLGLAKRREMKTFCAKSACCFTVLGPERCRPLANQPLLRREENFLRKFERNGRITRLTSWK